MFARKAEHHCTRTLWKDWNYACMASSSRIFYFSARSYETILHSHSHSLVSTTTNEESGKNNHGKDGHQ